MAITQSLGYGGSINEAAELAAWRESLDGVYGVGGAGHCKVTPKAGLGPTVGVSSGVVYGKAIRDTNVGEVLVTLEPHVSGESRWDLVVTHRDAGSNLTTFSAVTGTVGSQFSAFSSRRTFEEAEGATLDDQPLALVQVIAGSGGGTIGTILDARVWMANGGAVARDEVVLQYLTEPGTTIRIGSTVWTRTLDASGATAVWTTSSDVLPHIRLRLGADQPRNAGQWGQVALATASDTAGSQPWTVAAGAVTITEAGLYQIDTTITMSAATFAVSIYRIRAGDPAVLAQSATGSGASFSNHTSCTRRLAAGDVIVVRVFPATGASVEAEEPNRPSFVTFTKLSA